MDKVNIQDGDIFLNPAFGDLWVVDRNHFVKINVKCVIPIDEPEGFIKVGHIDGVINTATIEKQPIPEYEGEKPLSPEAQQEFLKYNGNHLGFSIDEKHTIT